MEVMSMKSVVIYASRYGNTRRIAEAIADGLRPFGTAQLFAAEEAPTPLPPGTDLIVIGGPTEMHKITETLAEILHRIEAETLHGVAAAAFDTRLRWPRWLAGSAGVGAWSKLQSAGARMIAPAESFCVKKDEGAEKGDAPKLEPGELERATQWAVALAEQARSAPAATPH
jgi:flavodoxin